MAGSPRIIARPPPRAPAACRRARVRQGQAFGGAEEAPSLTAAAPRRRWKYAVGTEECSRRGSNKRMECKGRPKWRDAPLTKKAPYKPDAPNAPVRFDEGGVETGTMARLLRHRQTKEAETDRPGLTSTAPHSYSTVKPLRAGMPGVSVYSLLLVCVLPLQRAREAAGATGTRHSPRPPWGREINAQLGRIAPRGRERVFGRL